MKKHKGLTLIELLIVISVICLLLAIVIPALKSAKERADRVKSDAEERNQEIDQEYIEKDRKEHLDVNNAVRNDMIGHLFDREICLLTRERFYDMRML